MTRNYLVQITKTSRLSAISQNSVFSAYGLLSWTRFPQTRLILACVGDVMEVVPLLPCFTASRTVIVTNSAISDKLLGCVCWCRRLVQNPLYYSLTTRSVGHEELPVELSASAYTTLSAIQRPLCIDIYTPNVFIFLSIVDCMAS